MPAAARVSPKSYFSPEEWAELSRASRWKGAALVAHGWAVILAAGAAALAWPWLIPLAVMVIGGRQLGLAILMHDAAHGALHPNLRVNDFLGDKLTPGGLLPYRRYHMAHHKFAQQAEDPDLVLSAPFPVTRTSLRRKIVRDLTGQTFFRQRVLFAVRSFRSARDADLAEGAVVTGRSVAPFLLFNLGLLLLMTLAGAWWAFFVLWLLPMATWFPMVTRLRNIAEHACVEGSATDAFRAARTTRASWWERAFIAPYWVNFHAEHHLFMHVPCWKLPALHRAVRATPQGQRMEVAGGYLEVLKTASAAGGPAGRAT